MNTGKLGFGISAGFTKILSYFLLTVLVGGLIGDSLPVFWGVLLISIYPLACYGLLLALYFVFLLLFKGQVKVVGEALLRWLFLILLIATFLSCGLLKSYWLNWQAEAFVVSAAHQLDVEQKKGHPYPKQLPGDLEQRKPSILQYDTNGKSYWFYRYPPLDASVYRYDSRTHSWHEVPHRD